MEEQTNRIKDEGNPASPEKKPEMEAPRGNTASLRPVRENMIRPLAPSSNPEPIRRAVPKQSSLQEGIVKRPAQSARPERTDMLRRSSDRRASDQGDQRRLKKEPHNRREIDRLVFGVMPRATMSLIFLVVLVIVSMIFAVKMTEVRIPIFVVVLLVDVLMGIFLKDAPAFVAILISASLIIVGAMTGMFIPICIGNGVMFSSMMMAKGI